jgi:hypothetical protein
MSVRRRLCGAGLLGIALVSGCDFLVTEVATAEDSFAVSFQVVGGTGQLSAWNKIDRAQIRIFRDSLSSSVYRDTTVAVTVSALDSSITLPLRLNVRDRQGTDSLGIETRLGSASGPLFNGSTTVRLLAGETVRADLDLLAVPARVVADRASVALLPGDSVTLAAVVLFASADTISASEDSINHYTPTWSSRDTSIVSVTPSGVDRSEATDSTLSTYLIFSYGELIDSIPARGGPTFYLVANPATETTTVRCPAAAVGDTGAVNSDLYTSRDRAGIRDLVQAGDYTSLETSVDGTSAA